MSMFDVVVIYLGCIRRVHTTALTWLRVIFAQLGIHKYTWHDRAPQDGATSLVLATQGGHLDVVRLLQEKGAEDAHARSVPLASQAWRAANCGKIKLWVVPRVACSRERPWRRVAWPLRKANICATPLLWTCLEASIPLTASWNA